MANPNAPFGLRPVSHMSGAPYNAGTAGVYCVPASDATNYFVGDPMDLVGTTDANGIPNITKCTAGGGNLTIGPFLAICNDPAGLFTVTRDLSVFRTLSVLTYVLVADDPDLLFEIQESGNVGTGKSTNNANFTFATAGSTVTGFSGVQLNSATVATTQNFQMHMRRPVPGRPDLLIGTNMIWRVTINQHRYNQNIAGV